MKPNTEERRLRRLFLQRLRDRPCGLCGHHDPVVNEFHHLHKKTKELYASLSWDSRERFFQEITGCTVVCANCHKRIHAGVKVDLVNGDTHYPPRCGPLKHINREWETFFRDL